MSLQRWRKKIKSKKPSLQEYIVVECEKVLYGTTKKGKMLERKDDIIRGDYHKRK